MNNDENPEAKSENEDVEQNPGPKEPWPAWGLPDYVIGNNIFADLPNLAQALGIKISIAPVHVPFFKSSIERFFRTTDAAPITPLRGTIDAISVETDGDPTGLLDP